MQRLYFTTDHKRQVMDITKAINARLPKDGEGMVTLFVMHTGAALATANMDPGTDLDFLDFIEAITPKLEWRHPHDPEHAPDHLLATLIGASVHVPFDNGRLLLGTWQHIVLIELDGPREQRSVMMEP